MEQQCGRTVCNSSRSNNIIIINALPQSSPSPSPSSSSHSSMEMVNDSSLPPPPSHHHNTNNVLFVPTQPPPPHHHNMAAAARVFGNTNSSNPLSPYYFMDAHNDMIPTSTPAGGGDTSSSVMSMRSKIISHPHFPRLLSAYSNCHKVGAPPEVAARLEEVCGAARSASSSGSSNNNSSIAIGEDPALDQFMEAYCEMLTKYEQELSKPFKEAMLFLSRIDSQFRALTLSSTSSPTSAGSGDFTGRNNGWSEDDMEGLEASYIDPQAEDKELKVQLLRRYSGYLGNLKQEFLKKKKKGKLPKEARQQLLEWWNRHYKWPYPSESQKVALAEATGLDQKQINNWFINQRKRHWKPTEDMQFVVMDAAYPHHYYLENGVGMGGSAFPLDFNSSTSHL